MESSPRKHKNQNKSRRSHAKTWRNRKKAKENVAKEEGETKKTMIIGVQKEKPITTERMCELNSNICNENISDDREGDDDDDEDDDVVIGVPLFKRYDEVKRYFKPVLGFEKFYVSDKDNSEGVSHLLSEANDVQDKYFGLDGELDDDNIIDTECIGSNELSPRERRVLYAPLVDKLLAQQRRKSDKRMKIYEEKNANLRRRGKDDNKIVRRKRPPNIDKITSYLEDVECQKKRRQDDRMDELEMVNEKKPAKPQTISSFILPSSLPSSESQRNNKRTLFSLQFGRKRQEDLLELEMQRYNEDSGEQSGSDSEDGMV